MMRRSTALAYIIVFGWSRRGIAQIDWTAETSTCFHLKPYLFAITGYCSLDQDDSSITYPTGYPESYIEYYRAITEALNDSTRVAHFGGQACIDAVADERCSTMYMEAVCYGIMRTCIYCSSYYDRLANDCPRSYAACQVPIMSTLLLQHNTTTLLGQRSCDNAGWRWRGRWQGWIESQPTKCIGPDDDIWPDGCVRPDGTLHNAAIALRPVIIAVLCSVALHILT